MRLLLFGLALVVTHVSAHGFVSKCEADGQEYETWNPWCSKDDYENADRDDYPTRIYYQGDPVEDVTSESLQCGNALADGLARPAGASIPITAGSDIKFYWSVPDDRWPIGHSGPVFTYLAHCENDDCSTFEPKDAKVWFKIDEAGFQGTFGKNGPLSGDPDAEQDAGDNFPDSYQQRINIDGYWATTIPADLPSGAYIARHEIISLHYANAPQFYPSCQQITVSGGGSVEPEEESLVSFPGAYQEDDPSLLLDFWDWYELDEFPTYVMPGPALYSSARITNRTEDALTSPIKDAKLEEATAVNEADSDEDLANEQDKRPARTAEDAFLGEETIGFSDNESKATGNGKEDEGHSTAREGTIEPNSGRDEEPTRFPSDKLQTTSSRITKPPSPTSMLDSGSGDRHIGVCFVFGVILVNAVFVLDY